jgi:HK97 family phage prohead protease
LFAVWKHHPEWLLATTDSGSLRLTDDPAVGLSYEADLPDTGAGRDCYELVRSGRIRHSSMAFIAIHDEFRSQGSTLVRHLTDIRLTEVSPVAQPGYLQTSAAVRSLARQIGEDPEDVAALAAEGELRSLFHRTDHHVAAPVTVEPGVPMPADVAQHSADLDIRRRKLELQRIKPMIDRGDPINRNAGDLDIRRRKLALRERRMVWEDRGESGEARSLFRNPWDARPA